MKVTIKENKRDKKLANIIKNIIGVLAVLAILIFWVSQANAFFWQNPVQRFQETSEDFAVWEAQQTRKERALFYDHCSALEWKQERGEEIKDVRYMAPCKTNDISLYFEIRRGFSTVQ